MRNRWIFTVALAFLLAVPLGPAHGQSDADAEEAPESDGLASVDSEVPASPRWPQQIILRPLTVPRGAAALALEIETFRLNGVVAAASAAYGILDTLQASLRYEFALRDFELVGSALLGVDYAVLRSGPTEIVARVRGGYNLLDEEVAPLRAGAFGRYRLSDKMAILGSADVDATLLERTTGIQPIRLELRAGFAYQVDPAVYLQLDTTLARINIQDTVSQYLFADTIPLAAQAFYTLGNTLDLGAGAHVDLAEVDNWGFLLTGRYFLGVR